MISAWYLIPTAFGGLLIGMILMAIMASNKRKE